MMRRIGKPERAARRIFLHATLIAGSILFSVPFIWLGSTSAKVADEMYPPRWIPQIPPRVVHSPYIQLRVNEQAEKPSRVSEENWTRLAGPVQQAIGRRLSEMSPSFPGFFQPYLGESAMAEGIFARILKRMPDEVFDKSPEEAGAWFVKGVDNDIATEVFDAVYRRVALD